MLFICLRGFFVEHEIRVDIKNETTPIKSRKEQRPQPETNFKREQS